ncbi:GIY-YIG nuclease family protein [Patescibacteria group bacterium]|nr:GIY-YIG nuclease family protein [Patescibacteria group bacterium]MCG2702306.1 GIY-YIG nuclease family protein [Candidatus Parcubacteria bacterium]MBU4264585.1 GIY-YIG nuclease family protein [Patescibacteria group bacterium]MBU4390253.1 GIY-YIG nuclease family protein [Patescibacteria group bacterium]MBU4397323.1 GIY-YIG nuclease family protein [Patescibacteria group bacterium]
MWFTYVLKSLKNGRLYVGFTSDIKRRLIEHNKKIGGKYSSKNSPFELIFFEAYLNKKDATKSEKFFKTGYGREVLRAKLKYSLGT